MFLNIYAEDLDTMIAAGQKLSVLSWREEWLTVIGSNLPLSRIRAFPIWHLPNLKGPPKTEQGLANPKSGTYDLKAISRPGRVSDRWHSGTPRAADTSFMYRQIMPEQLVS